MTEKQFYEPEMINDYSIRHPQNVILKSTICGGRRFDEWLDKSTRRIEIFRQVIFRDKL